MKLRHAFFLGIVGCAFLLQGCSSAGNSEATGAETASGNISGSNVRFDISDAVAVLKSNSSTDDPTKSTSTDAVLRKLTATGEITDVFSVEDLVTISSFSVAPDGNLYVALSKPITVNEKSCILLKLSKNNEGICLDDELQSIEIFDEPGCNFPTPLIQFDASGNVYYAGYDKDYSVVLRKYDMATTEHKDLINDNIFLRSFLVMDDGTVYLAGFTETTLDAFLRRLNPDGSLITILSGVYVTSLFEMPDGNAYEGGFNSVMRIEDGMSDDGQSVGCDSYCHQKTPEAEGDSSAPCPADEKDGLREAFCSKCNSNVTNYYRSPDDKFYVVLGCGAGATLWQYWPDVKPINTSVTNPAVIKGTLTTLLVAGYDDENKNRFIAYNTSDSSEIDLLNGEDIEIYHFNYSADSGLIIFDGLRFSDNTYIMGSIDTQNGNTLTVMDSGFQYDDMQFFK